MKRLGVTSLLLALVVAFVLSGVAVTGSSARGLKAAKPYTKKPTPTATATKTGGGPPPPKGVNCAKHPKNKKCLANAAAVANSEALAAVQAAQKAVAAARNCRPVNSARCQELARVAAAAVAKANQLIARAQALARAAGLPVPTFPATGGGGTAGVAGAVPVVLGVSGNGAKSVLALPATGGGAPTGSNSFGLLGLVAALLALVGLRLTFRK